MGIQQAIKLHDHVRVMQTDEMVRAGYANRQGTVIATWYASEYGLRCRVSFDDAGAGTFCASELMRCSPLSGRKAG